MELATLVKDQEMLEARFYFDFGPRDHFPRTDADREFFQTLIEKSLTRAAGRPIIMMDTGFVRSRADESYDNSKMPIAFLVQFDLNPKRIGIEEVVTVMRTAAILINECAWTTRSRSACRAISSFRSPK